MNAQSEFARVLDKAGRVVNFAVNRGKETPPLLKAYQAAETEFKKTGAIQVSLAVLIEEIKKTKKSFSIEEILFWRTLDIFRTGAPRLIFYITAVSVILLTGVYTMRYIAMKSNVTHLESLQNQNIFDIASRFWMMSSGTTLPDAFIGQSPPSSTEEDLMLEKLEQISQINSDLGVYMSDGIHNINADAEDILLRVIPAGVYQFITESIDSKCESSPDYNNIDAKPIDKTCDDDVVLKTSPIALSKTEIPSLSNKSGAFPPHKSGTTPPPPPPNDPAPVLGSVPTGESIEALYFDKLHLDEIAQYLPTGSDSSGASSINNILNTERRLMEWYGQIVLPVLLGMLGAIIYHLRQILNKPDSLPGFWRVDLRVLMGGLAGVSGSVFVATIAQGQSDQFSSGGTWLFLLAFLLGFSLELFFKVLDSLVEFAGNKLAPSKTAAGTSAAQPLASTQEKDENPSFAR